MLCWMNTSRRMKNALNHIVCSFRTLSSQKHRRIFSIHLHVDVEELRAQASGPKKLGRAAAPLWVDGVGSSSNTMSFGPRPICVPRGILIHETVWPQYTRVTNDRQTTSHDNSRTLHCNGRLKSNDFLQNCITNVLPRFL